MTDLHPLYQDLCLCKKCVAQGAPPITKDLMQDLVEGINQHVLMNAAVNGICGQTFMVALLVAASGMYQGTVAAGKPFKQSELEFYLTAQALLKELSPEYLTYQN